MNNNTVATFAIKGCLIQVLKEKLCKNYNFIRELFSRDIVSPNFIGKNLKNLA